ncbi:hypothetical protein UlMin_014786 [Ulmus minor]
MKTYIQNQGVALKNLENQMGQLANALSLRPSGSLPSNTETPKPNGKEQCKVIQLRSRKEITIPVGQDDGKDVNKTKDKLTPEVASQEEEIVTKIALDVIETVAGQPLPKLIPKRPPPPFPQRLRKENQDKQFGKFVEILKQLHINIPLVEALQQMPNYMKFMKDVLTNNRKLEEFEIVALTKECNLLL